MSVVQFTTLPTKTIRPGDTLLESAGGPVIPVATNSEPDPSGEGALIEGPPQEVTLSTVVYQLATFETPLAPTTGDSGEEVIVFPPPGVPQEEPPDQDVTVLPTTGPLATFIGPLFQPVTRE